MLLVIGPEGSGKTLLLKKIFTKDKVTEENIVTVPTVGVNILTFHHDPEMPSVHIRELGGSMAPIWCNYYRTTRKIMFVIDAANLSQLGSATLMFMKLIKHPATQYSQIAVVLNKTDIPLTRNGKEIQNLMRLHDVREVAPQKITVFEVSARAGKGLRPLIKWITGEKKKKKEDE